MAELLFAEAEKRAVTDDLRARLSARAEELGLSSFRPCFGSLERHPSGVYYLMVDTAGEGSHGTYLLRFAMASAETSPLFRDAILIGRLRPAGEREVVVNAIPFRPADSDRVVSFAEEIDAGFLPLPAAPAQTTEVPIKDPESDIPPAFEKLESTAANGALRCLVLSVAAGLNAEMVRAFAIWSAIRSGWRGGYVIQAGSDG